MKPVAFGFNSESPGGKMTIGTRKYLLSALLIFAIGVMGCSTLRSGPPAPQEIESFKKEDKSIFVLGLHLLEGKYDTLVENAAEHIKIGLASVDSDDEMRIVPIALLSSEPGERQWIYVVLDPGVYHLWIVPPSTNLENFKFRIRVPVASLLYGGTLQATCWGAGGRHLRILYHCSEDTRLITDMGSAQAILKDAQLKYGVLSPSWLEPTSAQVQIAQNLAKPHQQEPTQLLETQDAEGQPIVVTGSTVSGGSASRYVRALGECMLIAPLCAFILLAAGVYFGTRIPLCAPVAAALAPLIEEDFKIIYKECVFR